MGKMPPRDGLCPDIQFVRNFYCHSQYVVIKIYQDFCEHSSGPFGTNRTKARRQGWKREVLDRAGDEVEPEKQRDVT